MKPTQTPEEALQLLDSILAGVNGTRADHIKIQDALNVLRMVIQKPEKPKK